MYLLNILFNESNNNLFNATHNDKFVIRKSVNMIVHHLLVFNYIVATFQVVYQSMQEDIKINGSNMCSITHAIVQNTKQGYE